MSRYYEMSVEVSEPTADRVEEIEKAVENEWPFEDWSFYGVSLFGSGRSSLCGGESEEELAERVVKAVWKANQKYTEVTVTATYLEDLPCESYIFDEDEYEKLVGDNQ